MTTSVSTAYEIKEWLLSQHIIVPTDWVEACIDFIRQAYDNSNIVTSRLRQLVLDQWLDSDLSEIRASSLPSDLLSADKITLNGCFALQINSIIDVGRPAYSQLRQLEGQENDDVVISAVPKPFVPSWESKPTRMLLMNLTDGVNFVQGMEYQPITSLSPNLPPGFKVQITGPVECRFGVLLLTADKIQVLGGEVDNLKMLNSRENILRNTLQVPIPEQSPRSSSNARSIPEISINSSTQSTTANAQFSYNGQSTTADRQNDDDVTIIENFTNDATIMEDFDEDDFVDALDYEVLDKIEKANIMSVNSTDDYDDVQVNEDEEMLQEMYEFQENAMYTDNIIPKSESPRKKRLPPKKLFELLSSVDQEKEVKKEFFITIKGYIVNVLSRLECKSSKGWQLTAKVSDDTASIDVAFHDTVLQSFVGVSAKDMMAMQQQARENAEIKKNMMKAIANCKSKLQNLNCFMKIKFAPESQPCVIECIEFDEI